VSVVLILIRVEGAGVFLGNRGVLLRVSAVVRDRRSRSMIGIGRQDGVVGSSVTVTDRTIDKCFVADDEGIGSPMRGRRRISCRRTVWMITLALVIRNLSITRL